MAGLATKTLAKTLAKIPVTIVTGFLGAGKTTLIRHVLAHAQGRRLALVINEFGDVGVDGEILRNCGVESCPEGNIVELANGCLCCTVADDFLPAIEGLLAREPRPDHILIETSGLALPKPLVKAFDWPDIRAKLTVDGVIAVVDAAAVADGRFANDEEKLAAQKARDPSLDHDNPLEEVYEDQLLCADLILLNKSDLLSRKRWRRCGQKSRRNPSRGQDRATHEGTWTRTCCSASPPPPKTTSSPVPRITTRKRATTMTISTRLFSRSSRRRTRALSEKLAASRATMTCCG